ncbi:MAG TPA: pilus assembly protein TadG-related protein [Egibacteraceae bacterium]|nr:pilus assembly protein TadG-related protein [Egibacteraceae bacterium]
MHTDERGGIAVLAGVLLPALLAFSALGFAGLTMAGGERELQRAADAGALAAAAQLPLADLGGITSPVLSDLSPSGATVQMGGCAVVEMNLQEAALTSGFADTVTCSASPVAYTGNLATALQQGLGVLPLTGLHPLNRVVDVPALLPSIAKPHVTVTAGSDLDPPLRGLLSPSAPGRLEATAIARRRFKNAVLAPVIDVDDTVICQGNIIGLLGVTVGTFTEPLRNILGDLSLLNNVTGCRFDANPALAVPRDPALTTLDTVAAALPTQLRPVADALRELRIDLADLYDPPPDGSAAPTQWEIIESAAANNEDVLVVMAGLSSSSSLLSSLLGATRIPVVDGVVVPATTLLDGTVTVSDALPSVLAARGLFRATLVR